MLTRRSQGAANTTAGIRARHGALLTSPDRRWAAVFSFGVILVSVVPVLNARPQIVYDSMMYLGTPNLNSGRPPLVPVVYLLLGHSPRAITIFQCLFGAVCWSALLWEVARVRPKLIRAVAMFGVAAIACSTYVVAWYGSILSESLSISLLALLFASLARWQRTGGGLWAVVLITGLWALTRSTNGYLVLLVGLIILPYALMRHRRRVAQAGWVLAAGLLATILSAQGQLWQQPFSHSLTQRILPNAGFTAWFAAHGMPDDDVLRQFAGPYSFSTDTALQQSPALASFRHWMDRSGKFTYMEFLFTHPVWILQGTFGRHEELPPQTIAYYGRTRPWLPAPFRDLFLSHRQATLLLLGTVDAAALVVVVRRRIWGPRAGLWLGVIGLGLVTLAVDWAGDAWEIGRHSIQGTIGVALAGLMLITCLGTDSTLGPEPAPELSVRRRGAPRR